MMRRCLSCDSRRRVDGQTCQQPRRAARIAGKIATDLIVRIADRRGQRTGPAGACLHRRLSGRLIVRSDKDVTLPAR